MYIFEKAIWNVVTINNALIKFHAVFHEIQLK